MTHQDIEDVLDNPIEVEKEFDNQGSVKKVESEIIKETLTPRQEKFCQLYATDSSCFGNGVTTYMEVYDIDTEKKGWYKTACVNASRLLSNAKVYNRINELLEEQGLNDEFVDKQLLFLISQQADLTVKGKMIGEYNKIKGRIVDRIKPEGASEDAKAELYKKLTDKIDTMKPDEINTSLNDLLNS